MKCVQCSTSIEDKKFIHPVLRDEYLCINCFDLKTFDNCAHLINPINMSFSAKFNVDNKKDDLNISLILCTEGSNRNKDGFLSEDLESDYLTAKNQRLDWEHTDEVLGVITESEFVSSSNSNRIKELYVDLDRSFIVISGVIWKIFNQERSTEIIKRYVAGKLYGSMESYFDYAECSECKNQYVFRKDYCEHLKNRFNKTSATYRILRGNKFVGAGIVQYPGDTDAIGLSVAKAKNRYDILSRILNPDLQDYYIYMKKKLGR